MRNYNKTKLFQINMKIKDQNLIIYSILSSNFPNVIFSPLFVFLFKMYIRLTLHDEIF